MASISPASRFDRARSALLNSTNFLATLRGWVGYFFASTSIVTSRFSMRPSAIVRAASATCAPGFASRSTPRIVVQESPVRNAGTVFFSQITCTDFTCGSFGTRT